MEPAKSLHDRGVVFVDVRDAGEFDLGHIPSAASEYEHWPVQRTPLTARRKCIDLAKGGDTTALRLCMERLAPAMKSRAIHLSMPPIETADDVLKAQAAVIRAMACGEITPDEAAIVAGVLEAKRKAIETADLERRLIAVEASAGVKQR